MDRKPCTHTVQAPCVVIIKWCTRCSCWQVQRLGLVPGSVSGFSTLEVLESHVLPVEETSPDELQHLIQRAFRAAQEWSQDYDDIPRGHWGSYTDL